MVQLVKFNNHFYILDNSPISIGDWVCFTYGSTKKILKVVAIDGTYVWFNDAECLRIPNVNVFCKKITHSTEELSGVTLLDLEEVKLAVKDELFTIEDMKLCYNTAKRRAVIQEAGFEADLGFEDYIKKYHEDKTEWLVKIDSDNKIVTK